GELVELSRQTEEIAAFAGPLELRFEEDVVRRPLQPARPSFGALTRLAGPLARLVEMSEILLERREAGPIIKGCVRARCLVEEHRARLVRLADAAQEVSRSRDERVPLERVSALSISALDGQNDVAPQRRRHGTIGALVPLKIER